MHQTSDFAIVNQKALEQVKFYQPDFSAFDNGKGFSELYEKGEAFVQVFYYDKTQGRRLVKRTNFHIDKELQEKLSQLIHTYNEKLKEAQRLILEEMGISENGQRNYYNYNRVGEDIGIAHFQMYERNRMKEERKEMDSEVSEYEENVGPYGGAFRDEGDFVLWKEGKGFFCRF